MTAYNAQNERLKRRYLEYMREARGQSEASLDAIAKALNRFEVYTRFKDFRAFHIAQAAGFKTYLADQTSGRTGEPLSKATLHSTLAALKQFFNWLAGQPGFRKRLSYGDADYFNLSEKDVRIAKARRERPGPTLEQVRHVLRNMPAGTELECRDRALIAFAILTGVRDGALASLKLKHVDPVDGRVEQDAREVKTKFSKTMTTFFFPVGDDIRRIVTDWIDWLRKEKLWGLDDPLFPATLVIVGSNGGFQAAGLDRKHWSNAGPIRKIFRMAFEAAGLPYHNPHSFRKTLALLAEAECKTPEAVKAWSQNLGHESVLTTLASYGTVPQHRQREIMRGLVADG